MSKPSTSSGLGPLGASWKPKVAAILTLIGPPGLYFALASFAKLSDTQATQISGGAFAALAAFGLYTAKQDGGTHAPRPLAAADPVIPITDSAPPPSVAAPVEMAKPVTTIIESSPQSVGPPKAVKL